MEIIVGDEREYLYPRLGIRLPRFIFPTWSEFVRRNVRYPPAPPAAKLGQLGSMSMDEFINKKGKMRISAFASREQCDYLGAVPCGGFRVVVSLIISKVDWFIVTCDCQSEIKKLYDHLRECFWDSSIPDVL